MYFPRYRLLRASHILLVVVLLLSLLDIILLEKKFSLFGGGFLLAERIDTVGARLRFVSAVFALEFGLAGCFWYLLHIIGTIRRTSTLQTRLQFLFLYGGTSVAIIAIKYRILAYFGDFLSLAVVRNLGGGTLTGAFMYGAYEFMTLGAWVVPAITLGWYLYRRAKRNMAMAPSSKRQLGFRQLSIRMSICVSGLFAVSLASSADHSMRKYLPKTTPGALAQAVISSVTEPETSFLATFAESIAVPIETANAKVEFGERKDHLVLIISESTRADVLTAEVNGLPVSPNWRQLAEEGSAAAEYYSHTGFTSSSLKAIFLASLGTKRPLQGSLFEVLKKNGYQIAVISGQDESFGNIAGESSSEKLADIFFDARSAKSDRVFSSSDSGSLALSNGRVVQEFDAISSKLDWTRPVFVYVNLQAAHFPYFHREMPRTVEKQPLQRDEIEQEKREQLRLTYLNAVSYSDWATGRIVSRLKQLGAYRQTLVAVSGDHGESLFDDDVLGHGIRLVDNQTRTLLLANRHLPGFDHLLGQTDLAAQLLRGVGAKLSGYAERRAGVLQVIGSPYAPSQLGHVYPGGARFSIDNNELEVSASWLPAPVAITNLRPRSRESEALNALVADWKSMLSKPADKAVP